MPRSPRHALTEAVRRCLPAPLSPTARRFLALLDRRLAELTAGRSVHVRAGERALARRFLARFEGAWDDGDENLVRGFLDRWSPAAEGATREARTGLLLAARALSSIRVRPATLWFFLWEMESVLAGLAAPEPRSTADKPRGAC